MAAKNPGIDFDKSLIENVFINQPAIEKYVKSLMTKSMTTECQIAWLLRSVTCLDLTTLGGDDSFSNVNRLCCKAAEPIDNDLLVKMGMENKEIHVAAVCVYPAQVANCKSSMEHFFCSSIPIAAVATGFPSGQYHLKTRLLEIQLAVADGAREIDIVINRDLALCNKWKELYEEVKLMRHACGENVLMKTILATGELGCLSNVYIASIVCMMAGADFIKTSTGKETVNATLPVGTVMARAIKDYFRATGYKVGLKPAGGIRTAKDAISWQILMKEELGKEWLSSNLFRIGASGLLGDIEKQIFKYVTGYYASSRNFPYL